MASAAMMVFWIVVIAIFVRSRAGHWPTIVTGLLPNYPFLVTFRSVASCDNAKILIERFGPEADGTLCLPP
jgi:hypothetical protein